MHPTAYNDARRFVDQYLDGRPNLKIADVGSFDVNGSLRPLFDRAGWTYVGLDGAAGPNVDQVLSHDYHWPEIATGAFDVVVSTQTLEHVRHPWKWFPEIARICAPGGLIYICSPNTWGYHEYPVDCWRVWPDGLRALFEESQVHPLELYFAGNDTTGIGRLLTAEQQRRSSEVPRLTLLCTTSGRSTLALTLNAIKRQQILPGDEVLLVHDGPTNPFVSDAWLAAGLPGWLIDLPQGPHGDWGHTPRNITLPQAKGNYVVHLDDDDECAPGALAAVRNAIQSSPGSLFMFRIVYANGHTLWSERVVRPGNVGTSLFVHPADIPLGRFGSTHSGDYDFVAETLKLNPDRNLEWREEVVVLMRPHDTWTSRGLNAVQVDMSGGVRSVGDSGWRTFIHQRFPNRQIVEYRCVSRSLQAVTVDADCQRECLSQSVEVTGCGDRPETAGANREVAICFNVLDSVNGLDCLLERVAKQSTDSVVLTVGNLWSEFSDGRKLHRNCTPPQLLYLIEQSIGSVDLQCWTSERSDGSYPCPKTRAQFLVSRAPALGLVLRFNLQENEILHSRSVSRQGTRPAASG